MLVDLVIGLFLLTQVARGLARGLMSVGLSLAGQGLGLLAGLAVGPRIIAAVPALSASTVTTTLALLGAIALGAALGEATLGTLGRRLRAANRVRTLRAADSLLGGVAGLLVGSLLTWLVASAIAPVLPTPAARTLNSSTVLTTINRTVPAPVTRWSKGLTALLDASGFPQVFSGIGAEPSIAVETPDASVATSAGVKKAAASVVKVHAASDTCGRASEGSGWVAASHRVVTNAHVVAGATEVSVQAGGTGDALAARVVAFDPRLDLAILAVPDLDAAPLPQSGALAGGASAVVAGFPLDGPYQLNAARVRTTMDAVGADIYGAPGVSRQVYAIYGTVRPGNSGGPLLTSDGKVAGTVFARSTMDGQTGYVLTDAATKAVIDKAASDTKAVSTQACVTE